MADYKKTEKLLEIINFRGRLKEIIEQAALAEYSLEKESEKFKAQVQEMIDKLIPKFVNEFSIILSEYFTDKEIKQLVKFMDSKVAKKMFQIYPELNQKLLARCESIVNEIIAEIIAKK